MYFLMNRARILMQKHIFSMCAQSKDALKSEGFSIKGVFYAKVIKAYNGIFEPLEHILSFMGITAYFKILRHISVIFCILCHISFIFLINITRDGGKWWSKDHQLVVVKIVKNVAFS